MKIWDIALMATEGLRMRKFRFTLNLIGILIGCTAVTGLISLTQGLNEEVGTMLDRFGPDNLMILPGSLEMGAGIIASQPFNWRDLDVIRRVADIELVTPVMGNKMASFTKQGKKKFAFVYGVEAVYFDMNPGWKVEEGRNVRRGDTAIVVLGHNLAYPSDVDGPLVEVGDRLTLEIRVEGEDKEMTFRVIGIMEKMGGLGGISSDEDNSLFMPLRTCQQFFEEGGEYQYIAAQVNEVENVPKVVVELQERLGDEVTIMSSESMRDLVGSVLGAIEGVLGGVAAISLVVAGVGIINTMTISVMERTREIGVLKAIGAKSRDVLLLFLSEAFLTGLIGGAIGALLGFALSQVIGDYINMPVSTSPDLGIGVTGFAILTSVLSGLYPAWRAANLNPVDALRYE